MSLFKLGEHRLTRILSLLFITIGCDQLTKVVARQTLQNSRSLSYFHNSLLLEHAENSGAFLSLGSSLGNNLRFWIFTMSVALFLLVAFVFLLKSKKMNQWNTIAITLLIAGGFGNLIDRMVRGTVTDFINLGIGSLRTGIFNVADLAIVAGVTMLLIVSFKPQSKLQT
jgi:signal peptidase II